MTQQGNAPPEKKENPPRQIDPGIDTGGINSNQQGKRGLLGGFSLGGVASIIPAIIVGAAIYLVVLPGYVTKNDFTSNIQTMITAIDKAKTDVTKTVNDSLSAQTTDVNTKMANMSSQVTNVQNSLSNYATKGSVDALSGLPSQMDSKISSAKTAQDSALSSALSGIDAKLAIQSANITVQMSQLAARVTNKDDIKALSDKITALQAQVNTIQNQYNANNIVVSSSTSNISLSNTVASIIPVQIVNNGTAPATITLKLILTTSTSGITIGSINMNRPFNYVLNNPNVTFTTDVTVDASSTVTLNPQVTLTYTGTSPNIWYVAWSKN